MKLFKCPLLKRRADCDRGVTRYGVTRYGICPDPSVLTCSPSFAGFLPAADARARRRETAPSTRPRSMMPNSLPWALVRSAALFLQEHTEMMTTDILSCLHAELGSALGVPSCVFLWQPWTLGCLQ